MSVSACTFFSMLFFPDKHIRAMVSLFFCLSRRWHVLRCQVRHDGNGGKCQTARIHTYIHTQKATRDHPEEYYFFFWLLKYSLVPRSSLPRRAEEGPWLEEGEVGNIGKKEGKGSGSLRGANSSNRKRSGKKGWRKGRTKTNRDGVVPAGSVFQALVPLWRLLPAFFSLWTRSHALRGNGTRPDPMRRCAFGLRAVAFGNACRNHRQYCQFYR